MFKNNDHKKEPLIINDKFSNIEEFSHNVRSSVWRNQFAKTVKSWISSLEIDLDDFNLCAARFGPVRPGSARFGWPHVDFLGFW